MNPLLAIVSGGDNWIKLATIALIILSGGGNFFATRQAEEASVRETDRAIAEIHTQMADVYRTYNDSIARQKEMLETMKRIEARLPANH